MSLDIKIHNLGIKWENQSSSWYPLSYKFKAFIFIICLQTDCGYLVWQKGILHIFKHTHPYIISLCVPDLCPSTGGGDMGQDSAWV